MVTESHIHIVFNKPQGHVWNLRKIGYFKNIPTLVSSILLVTRYDFIRKNKALHGHMVNVCLFLLVGLCTCIYEAPLFNDQESIDADDKSSECFTQCPCTVNASSAIHGERSNQSTTAFLCFNLCFKERDSIN